MVLAKCKQEDAMPTLTIRNVPSKVARSLKVLAERNQRSMEQEIRSILEEHAGDRVSALRQIETSWQRQSRRPRAEEVDSWIRAGRE
jgi:plasmid stability protein